MNSVSPDEQILRDRNRTSEEATDSLQKSNEELLKEIFFCADDHLGHNSSTRISHTLAYFSSLLVNLSKKAEESTNENIKMQRTITRLTKVMLFVSIVLLFISAFQVYQNERNLNDQCQTFKKWQELKPTSAKPSVPQGVKENH
jgi:hypothetical protein